MLAVIPLRLGKIHHAETHTALLGQGALSMELFAPYAMFHAVGSVRKGKMYYVEEDMWHP